MGTKAAMAVTWKQHSHSSKSRVSSPLIKTACKETLLKAAAAHQPVSVAVDAGGYEFQLYSRGIFSGRCGKALNHGATIVGYGEGNGVKHWVVKNSWAKDLGESGYIRMRCGIEDIDGTCGIAMEASYPTMD